MSCGSAKVHHNEVVAKRLKIPSPPTQSKTIDGRYKVVREIGQGAAGVVYEGVQLSVDRRVAIKILNSGHYLRDDYRERFSREAKAIARLSHTNCITLHDFGHSDEFDSLYMVMEYVDGVELYELIKDEPLPFRRALKISIQIAEALAHAHKHGILHRDLKPENVLVTGDDDVKVLDFGLARMLDLFADESGRRLTAEGAIFGTPAYMSPEQCGGELDVTVHSDIYSLGIMLFQLFQGELPFDSREVVKILVQHAKSPPPPITAPIPVQLKKLIAQMLEKEKSERPSTATEVADTLRAVLLGLAVDDDWLMPDVSQEIQRSLLSRDFGAADRSGPIRRTTEDGLPEAVSGGSPKVDRQAVHSQPSAVQRASTENLLGQRLGGDYELTEILGEGAMSTVFAARNDAGDEVAVKVVASELPAELRASERFDREIAALQQLDHPSIVKLLDHGHDARLDRHYMVTELVRGDDLAEICRAGRASVELALHVGQRVAEALAHAHEHGVIHRDLKPSNIMLCPTEDGAVLVKTLDFGLARLVDDGTRLTADGMAPGTVSYMSPEQLKAEQAGAESDVYSLGIVLYQLLSGHAPYKGPTQTRLAQAILQGAAPTLADFVHEVPEQLSELIRRMMFVQPARRPRGAALLEEQFNRMQLDLGLRPVLASHTGSSADVQAAWRLRRKVHPPAPGEESDLTASRRKLGPEQRPSTDHGFKSRSGSKTWLIIVLLAFAVAAAAYALIG